MKKLPTKKNERPFVFVTGPYSAPTKEEVNRNIQKAINIGHILFEKGYYPIVPHVLVKEYYNPGDVTGIFGYESLMQYTLSIVAKCDILLLIDHSPGADREWKFAESLGMPNDCIFTIENGQCVEIAKESANIPVKNDV